MEQHELRVKYETDLKNLGDKLRNKQIKQKDYIKKTIEKLEQIKKEINLTFSEKLFINAQLKAVKQMQKQYQQLKKLKGAMR